jgi:23S rRNA pseudouridine2457 synthase
MLRYFALYKPYGVISQFTSEGDHDTLASLKYDFPKDVYPVGRLDTDSEGLLLLTNDTRVNNLLLNPAAKHRRTYLAQVEGEIGNEALEKLEAGITINEKGKVYKTLPAKLSKIAVPELPERNPPIRTRLSIPTSWIEVNLVEGKNRQVRRMTASVGFPTLRLVRVSIEDLILSKQESGFVEEIEKHSFYKSLKLRL